MTVRLEQVFNRSNESDSYGVDDDEVKVLRRVHQLEEDGVAIHRRTRLRQSVRQSEEELERMAHNAPINAMLIEIIPAGKLFGEKLPDLAFLLAGRSQSTPVSDGMSSPCQFSNDRLEETRVARRRKGRHEENIVSFTLLYQFHFD